MIVAVAMPVTQAKEQELTATEAANHVGETASVTGKVEDVHQAKGGNIFINMDGRHPNAAFTIFISADKASEFKDYKSYEGKTVTVTGKIQEHNKKPEISVNSPSQITVKRDGTDATAVSPAPSASP